MKRAFLVFFMVFFAGVSAYSQDTSGKIVGTVSAPDGAIPGATVVATDNQTGKSRTAVANGEGAFELPQLEFGTYTVKITAQGYKAFVANNVKIDAGIEYP